MSSVQEFFSAIPAIKYEGPESTNPMAFRYYDKDKMVLGKRMEDHLRPAICYWHNFCWNGFDVFGEGTFGRPWHELSGQAQADAKLDIAFEFFTKMGVPFYCFHDVDIAAESATVAELADNLAIITEKAEAKQAETGMKLLWGTANLFSNKRYMAGGGTNPDPEVFACAATQVFHAMNATHRLGGANYVFWGGREGYETLLNTDMAQELDQLARLLTMAVEHKHKIGFKGTLLIEPKPHEPTKHQYDRDTGVVYGFLKKYGLENEVQINLETNHATLAGNPMDHEIALCGALGVLGSVDANRGDPQNGWDTDQFWNDPLDITRSLYQFLKAGGFTTGGFNFDAKVRRQSIDAADLFHGHIGGLDALARGLEAAARLVENGDLAKVVEDRYAGWKGDLGQWMLKDASLEEIANKAVAEKLDPKPVSGRQEALENIVNNAI